MPHLKTLCQNTLLIFNNNNLDGDKVSESLTDIAVYCIIASIMFDEHYAERCHINPEDVTNANS